MAALWLDLFDQRQYLIDLVQGNSAAYQANIIVLLVCQRLL